MFAWSFVVALWFLGSMREVLDLQQLVNDEPLWFSAIRVLAWPILTLFCSFVWIWEVVRFSFDRRPPG